MNETQPRQVRVPDDLWQAFGEATRAAGTDRAKVLNAFMRRYVEAMSPGRSADGDHGGRTTHSAP